MLTVSATANSFARLCAAYGVGRRIDSCGRQHRWRHERAMSRSYRKMSVRGADCARKGLPCAMAFFSGGICLHRACVRFYAERRLHLYHDPTVIENTVSYMRLSVFSHSFFALVGLRRSALCAA